MNPTTYPMRTYGPANDPWDPIRSLEKHGRHRLTSVELTITNLCNMRCEHCAVGEALSFTEEPHIPLAEVLKMLDKVEDLETISITGGEPTFNRTTVRDYLIPILKYARERGVLSQLNSNITMDYVIYEMIAQHLDVLHISYNYLNAHDFHEVGFARAGHPVSYDAAAKLYDRMVDNARRLAAGGLFVSAESMINYRTHRKMAAIHQHILDMGCRRHEVHPMYPSDFAANLPKLSLADMRQAIDDLIDARDPDVWMLFGTLPFYACNAEGEDQRILKRLREAPNVTVRNDPDGRNRLNVDLFTGDVHVTDFAEVPALGNMHTDSLELIFARWQEHPLSRTIDCHCPAVRCCGPNLLVADMYYQDVDFKRRKAL